MEPKPNTSMSAKLEFIRPLGDLCPKDGSIMVETIQEHVLIHRCLQCKYESKTINGETHMLWGSRRGAYSLLRFR
jgi:hypothetical protein